MLRDSRAKMQSPSLTSSFNEDSDSTVQAGSARSAVNISSGTAAPSNLQQAAVSSVMNESAAPSQGSPIIGTSVSHSAAVSAPSVRHSMRQSTGQLPASIATQPVSAHLAPNAAVVSGASSANQEDAVVPSGGSFSSTTRRKDLLRAQKRVYRDEKKRAMRELTDVLQDPSLVILAEWLKVRGTLKSWTKYWCVLKPGVLVLYKKAGSALSSSIGSQPNSGSGTGVAAAQLNVAPAGGATLSSSAPALSCNISSSGAGVSANANSNANANTTGGDDRERDQHWVGTVLLNCCEAIERPSKKDGFCFKLFHPLDQSIWATRGPRGEAFGAFTQPLPYSHLIFRAPSDAAGRCWLDALELAVRCSHLLVRAMSTRESGRESRTAGGKTYTPTLTPKIGNGAAEESSALSNAIFRSSLRNVSVLLNDAELAAEASAAGSTMRRHEPLNESELERHFRDTFESGLTGLSAIDSSEKRCSTLPVALTNYAEVDADGELDDAEAELLLDGDEDLEEQAVGVLRLHAPPPDALETDEETDSVNSNSAAPRQTTPNDGARTSTDAGVVSTSAKHSESSSTSSKHSDPRATDTPTRSATASSMSKPKASSAATARASVRDRSEVSTVEPNGNTSADNVASETETATLYIENTEEDLGRPGDVLTEEVNDENKSIIWSLLKQLRPGMDLSRVVLPTFILEPRSLLDKFTDYYSHADILSEACQQADAYSRMRMVVKWYLSGFYKKPRGLKKPYNPIVGETFRCCWRNPRTGSRTFYVAEQVSHHPPVSALHVSNRQDGFCLQATVLARSKFYGNSLSAILEASCRLTMLSRGEEYTLTMPYVHCKGILIGSLSMEYGGKVQIRCERTGYETELEFKHKPLLSAGDCANRVVGRIRLGGDTLATISGRWDRDMHITDTATGRSEVLFNSTPEVRAARLKRYTVPLDRQLEYESERLWLRCSEALRTANMEEATRHKLGLEDRQRDMLRELKARGARHQPRFFEAVDPASVAAAAIPSYTYKFADLRAWDAAIDLIEFESDYVIQTKTRHAVSCVRPSRSATIRSTSNSSCTLTAQSPVDPTARPLVQDVPLTTTGPVVVPNGTPTQRAKGRSPPKRLVHAGRPKTVCDVKSSKAKVPSGSRARSADERDAALKRRRAAAEWEASRSSTNVRPRVVELSEDSSGEEDAAMQSQLASISTTVNRLATRLDAVECILHRILERLQFGAAQGQGEQKVGVAVLGSQAELLEARWAARGTRASLLVFGLSVLAVLLVAILFARLLV